MMYGGRRRGGAVHSHRYDIVLNGVEVIYTVIAKNSRAAISEFCRLNETYIFSSGSFGECGTPQAYCSKSIYNGLRACGRSGKCQAIFVAVTSMGNISAVGHRG